MRGVHKLITVLFFVGFLGVIITGYQNCGTQEAGNTLCFGSDCSRKDGSNGTPTYTPPPAGTQPTVSFNSTNSQKLTLLNNNCVVTANAPACMITLSLSYNGFGRVIFVSGGPIGGAQGTPILATCTGNTGAFTYNADYISTNSSYTFWLFETNTCPSENTAAATAFFNTNVSSAAAVLTGQRTN